MRFTTRLPLLVAIITTSLPAWAAVTRTSERTFTPAEVSSGKAKVELFSGSVAVEETDSKDFKVVVKATYDVETEAQADKLQSYLKLALENKDGAVSVDADYLRDIHWTTEDWPPVKLVVMLSVPKGAVLDLATKDGTVTVGNLTGKVRAKTDSGLIYLKGVEGSAELETFSGDVVVAHCSGDLRVRSVSGDFTVGPVGGAADISAHGGSIEAAAGCRGIRADTTGADLLVSLPASLSGESLLKSSGGNVALTIDPRLACSLDLRSSVFGKVAMARGQLPLSIEAGSLGKRSLKAGLNGGGAKIDVSVSGGSVLLEPGVANP